VIPMSEEEQKKTIKEEEQEEEVFEDDKPVIEVEVEAEAPVENLNEEEIPEVDDARKAEEVTKGIEIPFDVQAWHPKTELGRKVKAGRSY
jgi:hypothetical protein